MTLPEPIYVSGPMSGYENNNYEAFTVACAGLRGRGLTVLSPHEVGETPGLTWADYIRKDLVLLASARSLVVLDGWECSRGAQLEVHIAHTLGIPVVPLAVALAVAPEPRREPRMSIEIKYERQFSRDGTWWRCGEGSTLERCHDSALRYAGMQPKGGNFYSLPKRTLKITTEVKTEIVEES